MTESGSARRVRPAVFAARAAAALALAAGVALIGGAPERGSAVALQGSADLAITWTKTPRGATAAPGSTIRYVFTVANRGPDASPDVTLDIGFVVDGAQIKSGAVSDGARCTKEDVIAGLAFFVHCPMATLGRGASKSATLQFSALPRSGKTGGAILIATLSASSPEATDPDDSNSLFIYLPGDEIQYSIPGKLGGGKTTARKIRARVLIAPFGSQDRSIARYRRVQVFNAPSGASVELRGRGVVETGTTNGAGKLNSRKFVNRTLAVGSIFTVRVTKRGRIGDLLRIKVIAGGATLAGRQCIPSGGGQPRAACK
jgi:hypothetical protein